jgi:outer membrane biosynthesis protein TonB
MRSSLRSIWSVPLVLTLASAGAGCAQKTHAQTRAEQPPATLDVPQPPPRVVVPPQPEAPEVVEEMQPPSPARPRPARPVQRPEAKPDTARQDAAASEPAPAAEPPPTPETKPARPADAAGVAAVRQQMVRASQTLGHVNYAGLSNDMKAQYDTANRFLTLADQALKEGNLLFASTLVDKAGAIASLITGQ